MKIVLFLAALAAQTAFGQKFEGMAELELMKCERVNHGSSCTSQKGQFLGIQSFSVPSDNGHAEYLKFSIDTDNAVAVKVGTNSSSQSFFLTSGIQAFNRISQKQLYDYSESILEVGRKKQIKSLQLYSPRFEHNGELKVLKATITVTGT